MQNIKTHIVVGVKGETKDNAKLKTLYLGTDRRKARSIYVSNQGNKDFDLVGMQTMAGFRSRSRPKIDAENEAALARAQATTQADEVLAASVAAAAARDALGVAALKAEAVEIEAQEKLTALLKKGGASLEADDLDEGTEDESEVEDLDEGDEDENELLKS